jgi:hypothetical protein
MPVAKTDKQWREGRQAQRDVLFPGMAGKEERTQTIHHGGAAELHPMLLVGQVGELETHHWTEQHDHHWRTYQLRFYGTSAQSKS